MGSASTMIEPDVVVSPALSVAMAVRVNSPVVVGVQLNVNGDVVTFPSEIPFWKNCTDAIVPDEETALALMATAVPTVTVPPEVGEVMFTVGGGSVTTVI